MRNLLNRMLELAKNRLFVMLGGIFVMFLIISLRLFYLQVINGESYLQKSTASIMQTLSIPASRGVIYDRYGRPLATNQVAFSVKFDDSIKISLSNKNSQLSDAVLKYEGTENAVKDTLPITNTSPRSFTFTTEEEEQLWKESIGLSGRDLKMTADEVYDYLLEKFQIDESLSEDVKRKIMSLGLCTNEKNLLIYNRIFYNTSRRTKRRDSRTNQINQK